MATKTYSGQLNLLGVSIWSRYGLGCEYSVIEIGGEALKKVSCSNYLNSYLKLGEEMTLEIRHGLKSNHAFLAFLLFLIGCGLSSTVIGIPFGFIAWYFALRSTKIKSITVNGKKYS